MRQFLVSCAAASVLVIVSNGRSSAADIGPGAMPCGFTVTVIEGPEHQIFGPALVTPVDVNNNGLVVGSFQWLNTLPFKWSKADGFETLTPPIAFASARALDVNDDGWIVVTGETPGQGPASFVVSPDGTWIQMILPGGTSRTVARGINNSNVVVGEILTGPPENPAASRACFIWSPSGGMEVIEIEPGPSCGCQAINSSGTVTGWVGEGQFTIGTSGFVRVVDGVVTLIPPIPGGFSSTPSAISDEGVVVGWGRFTLSPGTVRGFIYSTDGMIERVDPDPKYQNTHIYDFVPGGVVVERQFVAGGPPDEPGLWSAAEGWRTLDMIIGPTQHIDYDAVGRANRAGAMIAQGSESVGGANQWRAVLLSPVVTPPDFDCDGAVTAIDLGTFLQHWAIEGGFLDLDRDGLVGPRDLGLLLGQWSQ